MLDGAEYLNSNITKKKKSKNKRRFSDEQIRSLEVMFETETKLEPKKKLQLAKELGLQPRQVAIWFQNKRARWKSKHIEKEYSILLANYNNLAAQCDSLKKEKHSLLTQLQKLKNEILVGKSDEKENERRIQEIGAGNSSTDGESDYPACKMDFEVKNIIASNMLVSDDEDSISISSIKAELLGLDEENHDQLLKMAAAAGDSSLASAEDWGSLDSDIDIINQQPSDESFQWWDFWS